MFALCVDRSSHWVVQVLLSDTCSLREREAALFAEENGEDFVDEEEEEPQVCTKQRVKEEEGD